jgi:hypothetical protein
MKKKVMGVAIFLMSLVSTAQTTIKKLQIDIRGRDCIGGSGLCSVSSTTSKTQSNMSNFTIKKQTDTSMIIEIVTTKLTIEEQIQFFGKEYSKLNAKEELLFIQDSDFIFDFNTLLYFELDTRYRLLKKGSYPLEIVNDTVQVHITLSPYI